jgi:uncharacterized protein (DUF169 family)
MAQDDELIFTAPTETLEDLLTGLRYLQEQGIGLPVKFKLMHEHELPESYTKIARMMGMEVDK